MFLVLYLLSSLLPDEYTADHEDGLALSYQLFIKSIDDVSYRHAFRTKYFYHYSNVNDLNNEYYIEDIRRHRPISEDDVSYYGDIVFENCTMQVYATMYLPALFVSKELWLSSFAIFNILFYILYSEHK